MTNQYFLARLTGRDLHLRAGDADRERIAQRLRQSHAEGRLDLSEFQQRLERCYEAKTFGDLSELVDDLPRPDDRADQSRLSWLRSWRWPLVPLLPFLIVLLLVSAASGHGHHFFWLWVPIAFIVWRMSWWRRRRWSAGARRDPGGWI